MRPSRWLNKLIMKLPFFLNLTGLALLVLALIIAIPQSSELGDFFLAALIAGVGGFVFLVALFIASWRTCGFLVNFTNPYLFISSSLFIVGFINLFLSIFKYYDKLDLLIPESIISAPERKLEPLFLIPILTCLSLSLGIYLYNQGTKELENISQKVKFLYFLSCLILLISFNEVINIYPIAIIPCLLSIIPGLFFIHKSLKKSGGGIFSNFGKLPRATKFIIILFLFSPFILFTNLFPIVLILTIFTFYYVTFGLVKNWITIKNILLTIPSYQKILVILGLLGIISLYASFFFWGAGEYYYYNFYL